jgi:hypothetical protein
MRTPATRLPARQIRYSLPARVSADAGAPELQSDLSHGAASAVAGLGVYSALLLCLAVLN